MDWRFKTGLTFVVLALMLSMVASCTPAASPGKEVTVGLGTIMTGPVASSGLPISYAALDYWELVNEQGGIDGVNINIVWEETAALVPRAITTHKRFVRAGAVAEMELLGPQVEALAPFAAKDELPLLHESYLTSGMRTDPEPWVFATGAGWANASGIVMRYAREMWTESRAPRVGTIVYDNPAGFMWADGAKKYGQELGFEFVGSEIVPLLGTIDTSVEWLRLAGKDPDWILPYAAGATLVVLVKDAARLEIQKKGIKIGTADPLDELVVPFIVGEDAEDWYVHRIFPFSHETQFPLMNDLLNMAGRRGWEPEKLGSMYFGGWICAQIMVEGIRLAIEEVGPENLDGRAVRDGLTRINDYDTGLMLPLLSYQNESPHFHNYSMICQVKGEKIVPITEWLKAPYPYKWY